MPRQRVVDAYDALEGGARSVPHATRDARSSRGARSQAGAGRARSHARYEELKARSGALDFLDLLLKARDLVRGNAGVRRGFHARFTHIFVDEFQDTDPLQAEILLLLASADPGAGRLAARSSPCRAASSSSAIPSSRSIVSAARTSGSTAMCASGWWRPAPTPVKLTTSFRSVPQIQACVNAAFAPVMTGDPATLQADYVPLSPHRAGIKGQPAVVALPVPEPYGVRNLSAMKIEQSLPDAVGAFIDWVVNDSGWKVSGRSAVAGARSRLSRPETSASSFDGS